MFEGDPKEASEDVSLSSEEDSEQLSEAECDEEEEKKSEISRKNDEDHSSH